MSRQFIRSYPFSIKSNGATSVSSGTNTGLTGTTAFSIALYIYVDDITTGYQTLSYIGNNADAEKQIYFGLRGGMLDVTVGGVSNIALDRKINQDQWTEVVLTYSGGPNGTAKIYINGTLMGSGTIDPNLINGKFYLFEDGLLNNLMSPNGYMNDARLWNIELTATQISNMYFAGTVPLSGLTRRYLLTEGSGSSLSDSSTNADAGMGTNLIWSANTAFKPRGIVNTGSAIRLLSTRPTNASRNPA